MTPVREAVTLRMSELAAGIVERLRLDAEPSGLTPGEAYLVLIVAAGMHTGFYGQAPVEEAFAFNDSEDARAYFQAGFDCGRGMREDIVRAMGKPS